MDAPKIYCDSLFRVERICWKILEAFLFLSSNTLTYFQQIVHYMRNWVRICWKWILVLATLGFLVASSACCLLRRLLILLSSSVTFFWRFFEVFFKYGFKWFYMFPIVVMSGLTRFCMVWHGSMWFCVVLHCCVWLGVVGHGCI